MEMRTSYPASVAAEGDELSATDSCAGFDLELGEVHVEGHEAEAVVDDDAIAFVVEGVG